MEIVASRHYSLAAIFYRKTRRCRCFSSLPSSPASNNMQNILGCKMSFIEGIGDDFLYALMFLLFLGLISLAWLSTHVSTVPLPTTLFIIERRSHRRNDEESERASPAPSPNEHPIFPSSVNETFSEHDSDVESSEIDESLFEHTAVSAEPERNPVEQLSNLNDSMSQPSSVEEEDQSLRITIKFLNETQKSIIASSNDTILKIKRLYFPDELASHKIVRFIYQGRELQDPETLRTCNIRDQTIIHCQISPRRHSTPNRVTEGPPVAHINANGFDTSSFLDASPINIPSHLILFLTVILGSVWYLRIKYRVLFTPISTVLLILITVIFVIFTCGPALTTRRRVSDTAIPHHVQHVHLE